MRLTNRFLVVFVVGVMAVGCAPKNRKEADKASNTPAMPKNFERVTVPLMITDPQSRAEYIITHFWDKFNFRDTMYCHVPDITEQAFVDFIYNFPLAAYNKVVEGVNKLLDSAQVDVVMYNYFYKLAEKYLYDPNSEIRNDDFYIPFLEHVVASPNVNDESKIRPQFLLQLAYRNRVGSKAENFVYTTASGSTGRLYNVSARYVLLMFYNPDCRECKLTTDEIKRSTVITSAITSGKLKVLAVYPDENLDIWRNNLSDIPSSWINGYDKSLTVRTNQIYDLKAIPTLYLLDVNKNVLLKDTTVGLINEFLTQNN